MKADNKKIKNRLNRIRGQIDGISKMVDEDKYCLDISAQLLAVSSAINSVNQEILSAHLRSCVADSLTSNNKEEVNKKIEEIEKIIKRLSK